MDPRGLPILRASAARSLRRAAPTGGPSCLRASGWAGIALVPLALAATALAATAVGSAIASTDSEPVEVIYVDANEGGASGGHSALRIGDDVYHFRAEDPWRSDARPSNDGGTALRLHRQSWLSFRVHYNSLENRNLYGATLALSHPDAERIASHLAKLHTVQEQHLQILRWLELETVLARTPRERVSVPGAGLFSTAGPPDFHAMELRRVAVEAYGQGFLSAAIRLAEEELAELPRETPRLDALDLRRDRPPLSAVRPLAGERIENALAWRIALGVLAEARPLDAAWLRAPLARAGKRLSFVERRQVDALARDLEGAMLRLLRSRRPDRGTALLATMARIQALSRSLVAGRLLTLDVQAGDSPENARWINPTASARREESLSSWHRLVRRAHSRLRDRLAARTVWDEEALHTLEAMAARDAALEEGLRARRPFRLSVQRGLPLAAASVTLPASEKPASTGSEARGNLARYRAELLRLHRYSLVSHNCATELVRAWSGAFRSEADASRALGGSLRPGEAASFVPFALDRAVRTRLRVDREWLLPSHRRRRIAEMRQREVGWAVALREGNTLTSTLYEPGPEDSRFLFFTDASVWSRPLLGALNLGYGLVQSGAGLVMAPLDGARRLRGGLRGTFYALPELLFFNIRKGRYEWVDELASLEPVP